jgi:predicted aspartyl protease
MGNFTHPITLYSADRSESEVVDALVDTGATFMTAPAALLERLGVEPLQVVTLRLANGEIERRRIGEVHVELGGQERTAVCVFGEPDAPPTIGAVTLQSFLLVVDTVDHRLVPVEALWLSLMHEFGWVPDFATTSDRAADS